LFAFAIEVGADSVMFLENPDKIIGGGESDHFCHYLDREFMILQK
jgi:hypothetical protein